jgi:thioredoxin-like negative regulator of GroEL
MKLRSFGLKSIFLSVAKGVLMVTLGSGALYASNTSIDDLLVEAKSKHSGGDYEGAARLYKQIIDMDNNHHEARKGLATVLIHAQTKEQLSEESDALKAVLDPTAQEPIVE